MLDLAVETTNEWSLSQLTRLLNELRHIQYDHREECDKSVVAKAVLGLLQI